LGGIKQGGRVTKPKHSIVETPLPYSLLKTIANYNTPLKNEVSVVYSGLKMAGN
jgi:hypothetical protein